MLPVAINPIMTDTITHVVDSGRGLSALFFKATKAAIPAKKTTRKPTQNVHVKLIHCEAANANVRMIPKT